MQGNGAEAAALLREANSLRPSVRGDILGPQCNAPAGRLSRVPGMASLGAENMPPSLFAPNPRRPKAVTATAAPPPRAAARSLGNMLRGGTLQDITNVTAARGGPSKMGKRAPTLSLQAALSNIMEPPIMVAAIPLMPPPPATLASVLLAPPVVSPPAMPAAPAAAATAAEPAAETVASPAEVREGRNADAEPEGLQGITDYLPDILERLFRKEESYLPPPKHMDIQVEVNGKMRAILVDWLIEVHMKYQLRPETLFLTVNIIDRYLAEANVQRKHLQLIGVVAMFIAAKFEEIDPPRISDFCYITDNTYSSSEIIQTECRVLSALRFRVVVPTAAHFMDRLSKANRCDAKHREFAQYLVELSLTELHMVRHPPSRLVAASLLLSNELLGQSPAWPPSMVYHARHEEQSLRECADELRALYEAATSSPLQATCKKYSSKEHHCVATDAFSAF